MAFTNLDWLFRFIAVVLAACLLNLLANVTFVMWAVHRRTLSNEIPFVSVLVPARNEAQNIQACIASLLNQDGCKSQIVSMS